MNSPLASQGEDTGNDDEVLVMNFSDEENSSIAERLNTDEHSDTNYEDPDQIGGTNENGLKLESKAICMEETEEETKGDVIQQFELIVHTPEEEYILGADASDDFFAIIRNTEDQDSNPTEVQSQPDSDVIELDSDDANLLSQNNVSIVCDEIDSDLNGKNLTNLSSIIITNVKSVVEGSENMSLHQMEECRTPENISSKTEENATDKNSTRSNISIKTKKNNFNSRGSKQTFKCYICDFSAKTRYFLSKHMISHNTKGTRTQKATIVSRCTKHFQPEILKVPKPNYFKCKFCSFSSKIRFALQRHILTHTDITKKAECTTGPTNIESSNVKKSECSIAQNNIEPSNHTRLAHPKDKVKSLKVLKTNIFKCRFCSFASKIRFALHRHILTHTDITKKSDGATNIQSSNVDITSTDIVKNSGCLIAQNNIELSIVDVSKCKYCSFVPKNKVSLIHHTRLAHPKKAKSLKVPKTNIFKCRFCSFASKIRFALQRHALTHADITEKSECSANVTSIESSKVDITSTDIVKNSGCSIAQNNIELSDVSKCKYCSFIPKNKLSLLHHTRLAHPKKVSKANIFKCRFCSFVYKSKFSLERHSLIHAGVTKKSEHLTDTQNTESSNVDVTPTDIVKKSEHAIGQNNIELSSVNVSKCKYCSFVPKNKASLVNHTRLAHPKVKLKCQYCTFIPKNKASLMNHTRFLHPRAKMKSLKVPKKTLFKCKSCSFQSKTRFALQRHASTHADIESSTGPNNIELSNVLVIPPTITKNIECSTDKNNTGSSDADTSKCRYCGFLSKNRTGLVHHTRFVHPEKVNVECLSCFKFIRKENMQKHKIICNKINMQVMKSGQYPSRAVKSGKVKIKKTNMTCSNTENNFDKSFTTVEGSQTSPKYKECNVKRVTRGSRISRHATKRIFSRNIDKKKSIRKGNVLKQVKFDPNVGKSLLSTKSGERSSKHDSFNKEMSVLTRNVPKGIGVSRLNKENSQATNEKGNTSSDFSLGSFLFVCETCGYVTDQKETLIIHKRTHVSSELITDDKTTKCLDLKHTAENTGPFANSAQHEIEISKDKITTPVSSNDGRKYVLVEDNKMQCIVCKRVLSHSGAFTNHKCEKSEFYKDGKFVIPYDKQERKFILTKDNKMQCNVCKRVLSHSGAFTNHKCEKSKFYEGDKFVSPDVKQERKLIVVKDNKMQCSLCNRIILTSGGFKRHKCLNLSAFFKEVKRQGNKYTCKKCLFSSPNWRRVNSHLLVHKTLEEAAVHKCLLCDFRSKYKSSLIGHMSRHDKQESKKIFKYACEICNFKTNHHRIIRNHKVSYHKESIRCDICGFTSIFQTVMDNHKKSIHKLQENEIKVVEETSNEIKYKCDNCDFKTNYKHNLQNHKILHININEVKVYRNQTYNVSINGKSSKKSSGISKIRASKDSSISEISFGCKYCEFKTKFRFTLKKHVEKEHVIELRASKSLASSTNQADGIKPLFKCSSCSYASRFKCNLRTHMQRRHTEITLKLHTQKPSFKCRGCSFVTEFRDCLKKHIQEQHTAESKESKFQRVSEDSKINEQPIFKCSSCFYTSKYKHSVNKHFNTCHVENACV